MNKENREEYIFKKKCLVILLYLFYISDISYDSILFRNFGFNLEADSDFKVILKSKKDHIHKYVVYILDSKLTKKEIDKHDKMGNVIFIHVNDLKKTKCYKPKKGIYVYFDESNFKFLGFIEGKYNEKELNKKSTSVFKSDLLYNLCRDKKIYNHSAKSFVKYLLKLYTSKLQIDLVLGAGTNVDYGAKDWKKLIDGLNKDFYKNSDELVNEIKYYVGNELFVSSKMIKENGFDIYSSLNKELYLFKEAKSFNDKDSTLYKCVEFLINKNEKINVLTYNYDTNLEYLLKKRDVKYNSIYDSTSFIDKNSLIDIYHVHGLLPYDKSKEAKYIDSLIFNESEYFGLYNNPYSWNIYKQLHDFTFNECVFVGISLTDPNMKRLLELAKNNLKFNFIFLKKNKDYSEMAYRDVTNYFFTYDLIPLWIDDFKEIENWLKEI